MRYRGAFAHAPQYETGHLMNPDTWAMRALPTACCKRPIVNCPVTRGQNRSRPEHKFEISLGDFAHPTAPHRPTDSRLRAGAVRGATGHAWPPHSNAPAARVGTSSSLQ